MLILTIRSDKPEAELGLFMDGKKIAYEAWQAHRLLAETLNTKLDDLLKSRDKSLHAIDGLIIFRGPGSFTGLRIGISVANALADSLAVPIIGETGNDWLEKGLAKIQNGGNDQLVMPKYGSPPHITKPKH